MLEPITRREVSARIEQCEKEGTFDSHVDPIDYDMAMPVDGNFHYIKKGFFERLKNFYLHNFVVKPFMRRINRRYRTKFLGRENLKGVKGAIVTCNHINKFDCLVAKQGLKGHKLFITAAEFNNQKGTFGDYMRAGGLLPFSKNPEATVNLNAAIQKRLKQDCFVMFYPEASMWWNYRKPRPFKNGAFFYAVKHNVPVIPTFITLTDTDKSDAEGIPEIEFTYHIGKPIFSDSKLSTKENVVVMNQKAFEFCKGVYEEFYKTPLVYKTEKEKQQC